MKKIILCIVLIVLLVSCSSIESELAEAGKTMASAFVDGDTKDTWNLRENAGFSVKVYEGVWWVPASSLGKSRYTNKQIASIVNFSPAVKKAVIGNLYEAIQLYQVSDFCSDTTDDWLNVKVIDPVNGYLWEKHCPGYYAVTLNRGNCSTSANWLIYLLEDDYKEWGTFYYQKPDGNGHVINYFVYDGFYYFIDMTHYRNDFKPNVRRGVEDGDISTYRKSLFLSDNIHKAVSIEAYVDYCRKTVLDDRPFFYVIKKQEVSDMTVDMSHKIVKMIFDSSIKDDLQVIYLNFKKISYGFSHNSTSGVNWSGRTRHPFGGRTTF